MRFFLFIFVCFTTIYSACAQSDQTGLYFNQTPPGLSPEIFAPDFISTDEFEFCGTFSPDGKQYFFTRRPTYQGSENRIYSTQNIDNKWTKPEIAFIAKDLFEFEPFISPDGLNLYFYSNRKGKQDNRYDGDLWVSSKTDEVWSEPEFFLSPINKKWVMSVSSTLDGTLYFSGNFNGKQGIFRSENKSGKYPDIDYLPEEINSVGGAHPFIASDESFLITDAQISGRGKPELFISFRKDDGTWTKSMNMGPTINATKTEFGASLSPDGKYLFFHRHVNGKGDIYWVDAKIIETLKNSVE